jgi:hypothetical protein
MPEVELLAADSSARTRPLSQAVAVDLEIAVPGRNCAESPRPLPCEC